MQSRTFLSLFVAILLAGSLSCARGQSIYAAHERQVPFAFGVGMSNYDLDYGKDKSGERRMNGLTAWADTDVPVASRLLKGFGLEIEGRDINMGRPVSITRMRQSTILGGPVYSWPGSRVRPYAKYLWGIGSIDFPKKGRYDHDTRAVTAPGIGLEGRVFGALWVHGDYEYQFWPHIFGQHALNPNGFTFGTVYDFRTRTRNRY